MFFVHFKKKSNLLIPSFIIRDVREWLRLLTKNEWCEQIWPMWANHSGPSQKISNGSKSLMSLTKNERRWAIHSGHSPKASELLVFLEYTHHLLAKNKQFTKKTDERIPNPGMHHTAESSCVACIIMTPRSVGLHGVWLLAVLAILDLQTFQCPTLRSVSLCSRVLREVRLRAGKHCVESKFLRISQRKQTFN